MGHYVQQSGFEVFVIGQTTSLEDWKRSLHAPSSELPELTEEQKTFARKFGISDEDYARSYLSMSYGQERMRKRGLALGTAIVQILVGLGPGYILQAAIYEATKMRWVARIQAPQGLLNVAIPLELADDIVDSNTVQDQEKLKTLLLSSLGRDELISNRGRA